MSGRVRRWEVWRGEDRVLVVESTPGILVGTASRTSRAPDARHPFLSGTALDASSEPALREALDVAADLPSFLEGLRARGFRVTDASGA